VRGHEVGTAPRRELWRGHRWRPGWHNDVAAASLAPVDSEERIGYGIWRRGTLERRVLDEGAEARVADGVRSTGGGEPAIGHQRSEWLPEAPWSRG
jgi:hypothetical protein